MIFLWCLQWIIVIYRNVERYLLKQQDITDDTWTTRSDINHYHGRREFAFDHMLIYTLPCCGGIFVSMYYVRIQDSGFRRCLFNIITFQICLHIEHIVYLDLGSYQAFSSWWGWSTLNLKTVLWFTTDSVVNILPRVKTTGIILIIRHWLRLETSTKAL